MAGILVSALLTAYIALQLHHLQFATPHLVDRDSYYHTRAANLLPERGLSRDFPWMQYSVWKDRFADKEFLYHALLVPFCANERHMVRGGKWAAWLFAVALFALFTVALRATGARAPILWTFLLFSAGNHFLFRIMEVRAHVLSIILFIAGTALLLKGRWRWLAAIGFIYSWSYAAPHLLIGIAVAHAAAIAVDERRFEWRGMAFATGGVLAGLILHPYFPNNLNLWWVQNVVVLKQAWHLEDLGLALGSEFGPTDTRSLLESSTTIFLSLAAGIVVALLAARAQRLSRRTFALLFITLACFTLYALSARFIEYLAPAAVWFFASALTDLLDAPPRTWKSGVAALLACLFLIGLHVRTMDRTLSAVRTYPGPALAGTARWIRSNVPPGETILHLNWGDFVQLFHFDPGHRYIVGLDPSFMYVTHPAKVRHLEEVRNGKRPVVGRELAEMFGTQILVVPKDRPWQITACDQAMLEVLCEDAGSVVYRLE